MKTYIIDMEAYADRLRQEAGQDKGTVPLIRVTRGDPTNAATGECSLSAQPADPDRPRLEDELISMVNHELITPMASLQGLTELLLEQDYPPPEQNRLIGILHNEAARLTQMLKDFVDIRRVESGEVSYDFRPVELSEVVAESRRAAKPPDDRSRLEIDIPPDLPPVRADHRRLVQVFSHLLSNAFKFSRPGSTVSLTARATCRGILTTVADEGIGIPASKLPRVFDKFYRVPCREIEASGTGLGLAIVQRIIEDHDGRVKLESEIGKGTVALVALPGWEEEGETGLACSA